MALLVQELTAPSKQTALFELELRTLICVETDQNYNCALPGYENVVPQDKKKFRCQGIPFQVTMS